MFTAIITNVQAPKVVSFPHFRAFSRLGNQQMAPSLLLNNARIIPAQFDNIVFE